MSSNCRKAKNRGGASLGWGQPLCHTPSKISSSPPHPATHQSGDEADIQRRTPLQCPATTAPTRKITTSICHVCIVGDTKSCKLRRSNVWHLYQFNPRRISSGLLIRVHVGFAPLWLDDNHFYPEIQMSWYDSLLALKLSLREPLFWIMDVWYTLMKI